MGEEESWPTGEFNNEDVKQALDYHAQDQHSRPKELQDKFNPPNHQTVIKLFRNGEIGGAMLPW